MKSWRLLKRLNKRPNKKPPKWRFFLLSGCLKIQIKYCLIPCAISYAKFTGTALPIIL